MAIIFIDAFLSSNCFKTNVSNKIIVPGRQHSASALLLQGHRGQTGLQHLVSHRERALNGSE